MAGKITDLTALASGHATGDLMEIVDISDATMSANGTNKKTTLAQLFGNIPAPALLSNGTKAAPAMAFASEVGLGFYRRIGGEIDLAYANIDVLSISNGFAGMRFYTSWGITWSAGDSSAAAVVGIHKKANGVTENNNGTAGSYAGSAFGSGSQTVAQLPAAATAGAGARSCVTDATATTFLSTVAGGGANIVPVMSNGTNWVIG